MGATRRGGRRAPVELNAESKRTVSTVGTFVGTLGKYTYPLVALGGVAGIRETLGGRVLDAHRVPSSDTGEISIRTTRL